MSRHEPQALTARACPADPYVAWLAEREADQAREERGSIRWIHRPRHLDGPVVGVRVPAGQSG